MVFNILPYRPVNRSQHHFDGIYKVPNVMLYYINNIKHGKSVRIGKWSPEGIHFPISTSCLYNNTLYTVKTVTTSPFVPLHVLCCFNQVVVTSTFCAETGDTVPNMCVIVKGGMLYPVTL